MQPLNQGPGYTKGPLDPRTLGDREEAYFYVPLQNAGDFPEPMVFAVSRIYQALLPCFRQINAGEPVKLPPGVELLHMRIDPDYARHHIEIGAAERPLIEEAKSRRTADTVDGCVFYAMSSPEGAPEKEASGILIDGIHRYVAAFECGDKEIFSALLWPRFFEQFLMGGIPYHMVRSMLGRGPDDTTRYDAEVKHGMRVRR